MAEKDFLQTLIKASGRVKRPTTTPKKVVYPADKSMDAKRNILYSWGVNKGGILGETLNGIGCLSQEVLNYLDKAQINALHKLGGSIWDIQREIYDARKAGIDTSALEAASKTAVDSLKALSATFEAYADAKKLDPKQVQQDVASVDDKKPYKEDIEIASALRNTGVTINYNVSTGKWDVAKDADGKLIPNDNAIKTYSRKIKMFSAPQIESLLDNYLNKSISERPKSVITADGIMTVFYKQIEKEAKDLENATQLAKEQEVQSVAEHHARLKTNSLEYRVAKLTSAEYIQAMILKQKAVSDFNKSIDGIDVKSLPIKLDEESAKLIDSDSILNSRALGRRTPAANIYKLADVAEDTIDTIKLDLPDKIQDNYLEEYDTIIRELEIRVNNGGDYSELLEQVKAARDSLQQEFENQDIMPNLDNEDVINRTTTAINPADLSKLATLANINIEDFLVGLAHNFGPELADDLILFTEFDLCRSLFKAGELLDIAYKEFKSNNPGKSFDDWLNAMTDDELGGIRKDSIREAYIATHPNENLQSNLPDGKKIKDVENTFDEAVLLLDVATTSFSPDEVQYYMDSSNPRGARTSIVVDKVKKAKEQIAKFTPEQKAKRMELAKKRQKNRMLRNILNYTGLPKNIADIEKNNNLEPIVSSAIERYLDEKATGQHQNDEELQGEGEPTVDDDTDPAKPKKPQTTTLDKLYPQPPDVEAFLKKMKPYSGKVLIKNFLKPLLKDIRKMEITIKDDDEATSGDNGQIKGDNGQDKGDDNGQKPQGGVTDNQPRPRLLTQSQYEASAFISGDLKLKAIANNTNVDSKNKSQKFVNLSMVMSVLATSDNKRESQEDQLLSKKDANGKDARDHLRKVALDILNNKYKDDPSKISEDVKQILIQAGFAEGQTYVSNFVEGFSLLTPELLIKLLEATNTLDGNKLVVGGNLPEGLENCANDAERHQLIEAQRMANYTSGTEPISDAEAIAKMTAKRGKQTSQSTYDVKYVHPLDKYQKVVEGYHYKEIPTQDGSIRRAVINNATQQPITPQNMPNEEQRTALFQQLAFAVAWENACKNSLIQVNNSNQIDEADIRERAFSDEAKLVFDNIISAIQNSNDQNIDLKAILETIGNNSNNPYVKVLCAEILKQPVHIHQRLFHHAGKDMMVNRDSSATANETDGDEMENS
ncbi:MAG: hypothetical protein E7356_04320 [Clostridiales bacterium]|nr:hypothetical protein [Clostridiales bacterium]